MGWQHNSFIGLENMLGSEYSFFSFSRGGGGGKGIEHGQI